MLFFISLAMFIATMFGGVFALRLRDNLHLVLGFSAGAVIGVAFFDLLPEALELSGAEAPADMPTTLTPSNQAMSIISGPSIRWLLTPF